MKILPKTAVWSATLALSSSLLLSGCSAPANAASSSTVATASTKTSVPGTDATTEDATADGSTTASTISETAESAQAFLATFSDEQK